MLRGSCSVVGCKILGSLLGSPVFQGVELSRCCLAFTSVRLGGSGTRCPVMLSQKKVGCV